MLTFTQHHLCARHCARYFHIHRRQPTRLLCPWDSPGKNTGVGCHFLLQCMKVERESEVAQSCPTLSDPMDCSLPGSFAHGIFQARVLEWGAIAFSNIVTLLLTYVQSTSYKMLGWMKHKLQSRLPGKISITSDMQMIPPLWQKVKKN